MRGLGRETVVELHDDVTGAVAASCTFAGKAVFAAMSIDCGPAGGTWLARPNRQVMPTGWRLEPGDGGAKFTVLDARKSQVGRLLNLGTSAWVVARDGAVVATFGFARDPRGAGETLFLLLLFAELTEV